jgi:predicted Fe-S protein YdhL (DUF1289 family)
MTAIPTPPAGNVASPCVDVCRMDPELGLCVGCYRTIDEIAGWSRADRDARLHVLAAVAKRRAEHAPDGAVFRGDCER